MSFSRSKDIKAIPQGPHSQDSKPNFSQPLIRNSPILALNISLNRHIYSSI